MFDFNLVYDLQHQALVFFFSFVDIDAVNVGIVEIQRVDLVHLPAVVVTHCQPQSHKWQRLQHHFFEDELIYILLF